MKKKYAVTILIIVSVLAFTISLASGASLSFLIDAITGKDPDARLVILYLRLPRTLAAFIVGSSLAISGVLLQSILRNELADPYTLGVSGGASFGATIAILLGFGYSVVVSFSFIGAAIIAILIHLITRKMDTDTNMLILTGISLSVVLSSGVMLLFALGESHSVHKAILWLMGDLSIARTEYLAPASIVLIFLLGASLFLAPQLDLLSYGKRYAKSAGVGRIDAVIIFWCASLLTALSVSLCGIVGFVGLLVPHITRRIAGPSHRLLLVMSAVTGGVFLSLCDSIGRIIAYPYEIPSGVITGFAGGIALFTALVWRKK